MRKAIEDVNSGVSFAFHRYSLSSQGENSEFDLQGVSPGAPKDNEIGTRQLTFIFIYPRVRFYSTVIIAIISCFFFYYHYCFTAPDTSEMNDLDLAIGESPSPFVIPVNFDPYQLPSSSVSVNVENVDNGTSTIQDNTIKLVVPSAFANHLNGAETVTVVATINQTSSPQ